MSDSPTLKIWTEVVSGRLVRGQKVSMVQTLTAISTGLRHRQIESSGFFVGDYVEQSGEPYFMFRGQWHTPARQGFFALPAEGFDPRTLAAYGPFRRSAQAIHEQTATWTPHGDLSLRRAPDSNEAIFSVRVEGQQLGYARVTDNDNEVWIDEIAVHPDRRENGIGTTLLTAVLSHYSGRAFALSCESYNPARWSDPDAEISGPSWHILEDWYRHHGFELDHTRPENRCMSRPAGKR